MEIEKRSGDGIDYELIAETDDMQIVVVSPMVIVDSFAGSGEVVSAAVDTEVKAEVDEVEIENRSGDGIVCEAIVETEDSQLVGVSPMVTVDYVIGGGEIVTVAVDTEVKAEVKVDEVDAQVKAEVKVDEGSDAKRKRGRPSRGQPRPQRVKKMKDEEEEDVCFICFDGGSLVLCDRRGCPKAYHPACIKRDEAFFSSKAKWNCGWHICSICQKAAHYMCYTCTYSLCKACTKEADYVCVRANKGFCTICMRTIMLIENNDQGNKEMPRVDFDDKSSWEYLFKIYWIYLKGKLSLTLDELTQAKNPWKAAGAVACKTSLNMHYGVNDSKGSVFNSPVGHPESNDSKRRAAEQSKLPNNGASLTTDKSSRDEDTTSNEPTDWASKDLLEFVAHMKNGDTSVLSEFDVQSLLLDYIKRNNLRDPSRKSQIICDLRLKNLFGKQRVGHFEMLKLLEFHFHTKDDIRKDVIQDNIINAVLSQVEVRGNNENLLMMGKDKKRKNRTRGEGRGSQINMDEYAAINVHNMNLIYLRRNLMESLVVDSEKFNEKVVGSIVRIRISNNDHKQDMYRLVQVVGTSRAAVPYKIGEKTADVVLEILNLDKKETISIDVISNQSLSEDECRRLRQSIKCGLVKRLTIGQVQKKAVALQKVRLDDWLETEVLRLNHLRDRANEKGHKKGLRECIEKLELLKTPEERQRRLHEIPEVHADPNMDPNCDSDENAGEVNKKQDAGEHVKPRFSGFGSKRWESISAQNGDSQNNSGTRVWKGLNTCVQSRILSTRFYLEKGAASTVVQRVHDSCYEGNDSCRSKSWKKPDNGVDSSCSVVAGWNNQAVLMKSGSTSVCAPETSISSFFAGSAPSADDCETEKLWHYRDPNGKIQGPFCMVQLRKWSTTGYFPPEMRIWSTNNEEVDSFLLNDVLNGKFHKVFPFRSNISLPSQGVTASGSRLDYCDYRSSGSMNTTSIDDKQSDQVWNSSKVLSPSNCNNESVKADGWGSQSSNLTVPVSKTDGHIGISQFSDSLKFNLTSLQQGKGHEGKREDSASNHGNWSAHENTACQTVDEQSHENQSDTRGYPQQSSGGNQRPLRINLSSHNGDSNARSSDSSEPKFEIDIPNLPSPTPKTSNENLEGQSVKAQPSVPLSLPVQDSGLHKLPSPMPELSYGDEKAESNIQNRPSPPLITMDRNKKIEAAEDKLPDSSKFPVQDSGSSWSTASSLVVGGERQCHETADEWGGCSPTHTKRSVEEGDSGLGSVTSLKPPEMANDHAATPTSKCDQLNTPSPKCEQHTPPSPSGERRCRETVDEWGGCSSTHAKPSVEEGDPGLGYVTWLKPPDLANDHTATPTSKCDQLTPSPSGERRCHETADEWGGCSPTRANPSIEEGDSGLGSVTSLKLPELDNDYAAIPTSKCDQLTTPSPKCDLLTPSPSHPTFNESTWHLEPIEFSTLDEESVSDLLAEVDAMESQCGLASPSSVMYSGDELFEDPNTDWFTSLGVLSRPLDSGKSDTMSSTGDIILPRQSTMTDETLGASRPCILDSVKLCTSFEANVLTQPTDFSVNKAEAGPNCQTDTSQRAEQNPMNPSWGTMQGQKLGFGRNK